MIKVGESYFNEEEFVGKIGEVSWNLRFEKLFKPLYFYPEKMYKGGFPKTKVISSIPGLKANGEVVIKDKKFEIRGGLGEQAHHWGVKHSNNWIWFHINLNDKGYLTGISTKIGFIRATIIALKYNKIEGIRTGIFKAMTTKLKMTKNKEIRLNIRARIYPNIYINTELSSPREHFLGVTYRNPDNTKVYCFNSSIATAKVNILQNEQKYKILELENKAAFEIGTTKFRI